VSVKDYKELEVYRLAFDAAMEIFEISKTFPQEEKYSLTDQIWRSSRSVCANIAEAWRKRRYEAAFVSKLSDADTEAAETEVWLDFSLKCGYIQEAGHKKLRDKHDHICRQLYIMMQDASSWCHSSSLRVPRSSDAPRSTLHAPRAFTLVELIVVVAVISMLLKLLIPNIRTMREKAWSSNCRNNLRQYGVAMNQYMADYNGYFIYPSFGVGAAIDGSTWDGADIGDFGVYDNRPVLGSTVGGAAGDDWQNFVRTYVGANVTLASLSAGVPAVSVCPVVLRDLHTANYFDPRSSFKGYNRSFDTDLGQWVEQGDFESSSGAGYDDAGNVLPATYLDSAFTTYAINPSKIGANKKDIRENVMAFIDWNARDGWWATLGYTNWMFSGTNSQGDPVSQFTPKWTNAWWLTEVGFHHLQGGVYGANYVAMDGHVGWISSNAISITNFTTGL